MKWTYLIYIERALNPKGAKYTFFSNAHGTVSNTDHMIGQKTSSRKLKSTSSRKFKSYQAFSLTTRD